MGRRSATETIVRTLQAFSVQRTWKQSELAAHLDVNVPALKKVLQDLKAILRMPLHREEESHREVYWSVEKDWYPGGAFIQAADMVETVRFLQRLPRGSEVRALIKRLTRDWRASERPVDPNLALRPIEEPEEKAIRFLEDAIVGKYALEARYFVLKRGVEEIRILSPHCLQYGRTNRLIATCHKSRALRWFRVDGFRTGKKAVGVPFREPDRAALEDLVSKSTNGYRDESSDEESRFFVRNPEATWVAKNLPEGCIAILAEGGIEVSSKGGTRNLARFVVSLGDTCNIHTTKLRAMALELAEKSATVLRDGREDGRETR